MWLLRFFSYLLVLVFYCWNILDCSSIILPLHVECQTKVSIVRDEILRWRLVANGRLPSRQFDVRICRSDATRRDLVSRALVKVDYFGRLMSYWEIIVYTFFIDTIDGKWIGNVSREEKITQDCMTHRGMISRESIILQYKSILYIYNFYTECL